MKTSQKEVWQTTNQQPWVSAFVDGAIKFKTRNMKPPEKAIGCPVLLHASTKIWPDWLMVDNPVMRSYADRMQELRKETFGKVLAVGILHSIRTSDTVSSKDLRPWDMADRYGSQWNCAAAWAWNCRQILRLTNPVKIRGFQAPFARAKEESIQAVLAANPEAADILQGH